eukprot:1159639-Pelagomonas_calceolata.AAC.8
MQGSPKGVRDEYLVAEAYAFYTALYMGQLAVGWTSSPEDACISDVLICALKCLFFTLAVFFRESIYMGETNFSPAEVQQLVYKMGEAYRGNKYHLLQRNCNNFASDLAYQLVGKPAPSWVSGHERKGVVRERPEAHDRNETHCIKVQTLAWVT